VSESEYSPTADEQLLIDSVGSVSLEDSYMLEISQSQSKESANSGLHFTLCCIGLLILW